MKVVAILQARCSSTRLPNKVLKLVLGKPMLQWQIERIQRCKLLSNLIIATSNKNSDRALVELCKSINVDYFTGDLNNVLDRFYQAALLSKADIVVRLTGDCPLIDADIIDAVIATHLEEKNDYTSNIDPETFPDGLDVEVMNFSALKDAWLNAGQNFELEHVTPYIRNNLNFKKGSYISEKDYSEYRWTVDEPQDFEFVSRVYSILGNQGQYFGASEIYKLLKDQPELLVINSNIKRNEGYKKTLAQDISKGEP